jgi:hypothetical protein
MQHLDSFKGLYIGYSFSTVQIAYLWLTFKLVNLSEDTLSPAPNPDFVHLLNDFFWLHLASTVAFLFHFFKLMKWSLTFLVLLTTVWQIYLLIESCVALFNYNRKMGYSVLQVEDSIHFFVFVEIVTYASNILVLMIYLMLESFRNEWQVRKVNSINNENDDGFAR